MVDAIWALTFELTHSHFLQALVVHVMMAINLEKNYVLWMGISCEVKLTYQQLDRRAATEMLKCPAMNNSVIACTTRITKQKWPPTKCGSRKIAAPYIMFRFVAYMSDNRRYLYNVLQRSLVLFPLYYCDYENRGSGYFFVRNEHYRLGVYISKDFHLNFLDVSICDLTIVEG